MIDFDLGVDDMAEGAFSRSARGACPSQEVDRLDESGELEAYFAERRHAYQERYRKEGIEQGLE